MFTQNYHPLFLLSTYHKLKSSSVYLLYVFLEPKGFVLFINGFWGFFAVRTARNIMMATQILCLMMERVS